MTPGKITRRGLFKFFAGLAPTLLVGKAPAATLVPPVPTLRKVYLAEVAIAGFRCYDGMRPEVLAALQIGDELTLRRQPDNPHDLNAIAIFTQEGRKLGYVPRIKNLAPATIADQNVPLGADIIAVAPDAPPWERVRVHVYQQIADVSIVSGTQKPTLPYEFPVAVATANEAWSEEAYDEIMARLGHINAGHKFNRAEMTEDD